MWIRLKAYEECMVLFCKVDAWISGCREGSLCDVVLLTTRGEIAAHRVILAAASSYFRTMFAGFFAESERERIQIKGIEPSALAMLVQ